MSEKIIILGGGWAGLLSAKYLAEKYPDASINVLEKSSYRDRGGLLKTEFVSGNTFDIGGPHILFSRNEDTLKSIVKILGDNVKKMHRKGFIYFNGKFIQYPFENGMFRLPKSIRITIGKQIIENIMSANSGQQKSPVNFNDWIFSFFGNEMGNLYLKPYNEKIWKRDLSSIDSDWVYNPGRLPLPKLDEIVKAIAGQREEGYKEQSYFFYPAKGGIQALYDSLLKQVKKLKNVLVDFDKEVKTLKREGNNWRVNSRIIGDTIVNTLPLPNILNLIDLHFPRKIEVLGDFNKVVTVGLVLERSSPQQLAVYVPQKDIIFHRYTWMSYLNGKHQKEESSVLAEITVPKNEDYLTSEQYVKKVISGFMKIGVIRKASQVKDSKVWFNYHGYPIYLKGHSKVRTEVMEELNNRKIYSVGRWGSWQYWNTDKVYEAVQMTVNHIKLT